MAAPKKFDEETRHRAVRMYQERIAERGDTKLAARKHVGGLLDVNPATLRNWVEKTGAADESDGGSGGADRDAEFRALRRENAELRRATYYGLDIALQLEAVAAPQCHSIRRNKSAVSVGFGKTRTEVLQTWVTCRVTTMRWQRLIR